MKDSLVFSKVVGIVDPAILPMPTQSRKQTAVVSSQWM
jgi:hypothetical protein